MATQSEVEKVASEIVAEDAKSKGSLTSLLKTAISGLEKVVKGFDEYLRLKGIDVSKYADKVKDSTAGKAVRGLSNALTKKVKDSATYNKIMDGTIAGKIKDKFGRTFISGTDPPLTEEEQAKRDSMGKIGRTLFDAKRMGKSALDKAKDFSKRVGFDVTKDYVEEAKLFIDPYKKFLHVAYKLSTENPVNEPLLADTLEKVRKAYSRIEQYVNRISEYADIGQREYDAQEEGKKDARLLRPKKAFILIRKEVSALQSIQNKIDKQSKVTDEQLMETMKNDNASLKEIDTLLTSQSTQVREKDEKDKTSTDKMFEALEREKNLKELGKDERSMMSKGIGNISGVLSGTNRLMGRRKDRGFIGNRFVDAWDLGKGVTQIGLGAMGSKTARHIMFGGFPLLAKNLIRGPGGIFEYGAKKGYNAWKNRGKSLNEDGEYVDNAELIAKMEEDGIIEKRQEVETGSMEGMTKKEQKRLERETKKEQKRLDKERNKAIKSAMKENKKKERERIIAEGGGWKNKLLSAGGSLMGMASTAGSWMGNMFSGMMDSQEDPEATENDVGEGTTSVVTQVGENDDQWVADKAQREQARADEIEAEKAAVKARKKLKGQATGNGFIDTLLGGMKSLVLMALPMMGTMLKWAFKPFYWAGKGIIWTGKFLNRMYTGMKGWFTDLPGKIGGALSPMFEKLGSKLAGWASSIGGALTKAKDWVKGTKIGGAIAKAGSWVAGKGGMLKAGFSAVKNSWFGKAATWAGKFAMKYGGRILATVFTGPVGWVINAGLLLYDVYSIYKWATKGNGDLPETSIGDILRARLYSYGLSKPNQPNYMKVFSLEEETGPYFKRDLQTGKVNFELPEDPDKLKAIHEALDMGPENPEMNETKMTWLMERFVPSYKAHLEALWAVKDNLKLGNIDQLNDADMIRFVNAINVPTEVFNVKVLPFAETPYTEVNKKMYDEEMVKIKKGLVVKAANSTNKDKDPSKQNSRDALDLASKAQSRFDDAAKTGPGRFERYFDPDRGNAKLRENEFTSKYRDYSGTKFDDVNFGKGGEYAFSAGSPQNISGVNDISMQEAFAKAAKMSGVPEELLWTFAKIESSLNPMAQNPNSSAKGLFQFLNATWKEMVEGTGSQYGLTMKNANRFNPLHSALMGAEYMKKNMNVAQAFGSEGIDLGTGLYLAHFFGPGGATKALKAYKANKNVAARDVVSTSVYNANHSVMSGRSMGQVFEYFQKRFHNVMKKKPEEYASYKAHKEKNAGLYEGLAEAKYTNDSIDFSNFGQGSGGNVGGISLSNESGYSSENSNFVQGGQTNIGGGVSVGYSTRYGGAGMGEDRNMEGREHIGAIPNDIREIYGMEEGGTNKGQGVTIHPIKEGYGYRVSSLFGPRNTGIEGASRYHKGVDFAAPKGVPVVATGAGKVVIVSWLKGYGNAIYINHPDGLQTRYAHLSAFNVRQGQDVKAGDVIGLVGNTGIGSGPHLHFEVRKISTDTAMDPMKFPVIKDGNNPKVDVDESKPENTESDLTPEQKAGNSAVDAMMNQNATMGMNGGSASLLGGSTFGVNGSANDMATEYINQRRKDDSIGTVDEKGIAGFDDSVQVGPTAAAAEEMNNITINNEGVEAGLDKNALILNDIKVLMEQLVQVNKDSKLSAEQEKQLADMRANFKPPESKDSKGNSAQEQAFLAPKPVVFQNGNDTGIDVGRKRNR